MVLYKFNKKMNVIIIILIFRPVLTYQICLMKKELQIQFPTLYSFPFDKNTNIFLLLKRVRTPICVETLFDD